MQIRPGLRAMRAGESWRTRSVFALVAVLLTCVGPCFAKSGVTSATIRSGTHYYAVRSAERAGSTRVVSRYGIPFLEGALPKAKDGTVQLNVNMSAKQIYLFGMAEVDNIQCWWDPRVYSVRAFVGDRMGEIRVNYADGSTQIYPLILGESIWWGKPFYQMPYPFPTNPQLRHALAASLRLYPAAPVKDGNYVAVIEPKPIPIRSINVVNSPRKNGAVILAGVTLESADSHANAGVRPLPAASAAPELVHFAKDKPLLPDGEAEHADTKGLENLRRALYLSDELYRGHVKRQIPAGYFGPKVSFEGDNSADILTNVFYANVQDMLAKIDPDGMYHTSTRGAVSWGGRGFGTFAPNVGMYYSASWSRDMGRTLQELASLGYLKKVSKADDYALRESRLWENPSLKFDGVMLPPHWGRVINRPDPRAAFENDGHGLLAMSLYKLWLRLPNRNQWLRARWPDVKAAGDWIIWQFNHPAISGAKNGVLHTTGEAAGGNGYSVYADYACMNALDALAQMADSIGEHASATLWRQRAQQMPQAMARQYIINDPKYGRVWTLKTQGWPDRSTVLGPLILGADYAGFAPNDGEAAWRSVDKAAYRRLIATYPPFGFYGQAMGYGQGFVTESALLLDEMRDATKMLDWAAKEIYNPRTGSFIVPEGVQIDPTGRYWYQTGDLGNGVQEAEIIKTLRIVVGIDDTEPNRLQLLPRPPYGWREVTVQKYPVEVERSGHLESAQISYKLRRSGSHMRFDLSANQPLGSIAVRLGPFAKKPKASDVRVNGEISIGARVEYSGDSWWVAFRAVPKRAVPAM